jgi:hypothetical protein
MPGCWNVIVYISDTRQTPRTCERRSEGCVNIETSKDAGIEVRRSTLEPSHVPVVCKELCRMSVVVVCGMRRVETSLPPRKQHTASLIKFGEQCYGSSYVQISTGNTSTLHAFQTNGLKPSLESYSWFYKQHLHLLGGRKVRFAIKITRLDRLKFHPVIKHIKSVLIEVSK